MLGETHVSPAQIRFSNANSSELSSFGTFWVSRSRATFDFAQDTGKTQMGSITRIDRPKPWRARYYSPDGRQISKTFRRKIDAEKWLRREESKVDRGDWVDPAGGTTVFAEVSESWFAGLHRASPPTVVYGSALECMICRFSGR